MDHPFSMSLNPMTALKDVKYATSVSTLYNLTCVVMAFRLAHVSILSLGQKQSALSSSTFIFKRF